MKKIVTLVLTIGLALCTNIPAQASSNSVYVCTSEVFTNMPSVHTDSAHWEFRNDYWTCADETYHQALYDRWIETNGKWYYVNKDGHMLSNTLIYNIYNHS